MTLDFPDLLQVADKFRPALRYHGGKWALAPWIISHFPEHKQYVEPYAGAASVLLRKRRSKVEVYNDMDEEVVDLFRLLREPVHREQLIHAVAMTPFSRREFELAYEVTTDRVERARRLVVRSWHGFGTHSFNINNSNGFRGRCAKGRKNYAREWIGVPCALSMVAERLDGVTIECLPALKIISYYDMPGALFYVDPPYPRSTRNCNEKGYKHEMSDHDHRTLAFLLRAARAKVILSGYACDLYDRELYSDWHRVETKARANGQTGSVARIEVLWMNFVPEVKAK
jgi:DNA adenine methylase